MHRSMPSLLYQLSHHIGTAAHQNFSNLAMDLLLVDLDEAGAKESRGGNLVCVGEGASGASDGSDGEAVHCRGISIMVKHPVMQVWTY